MQHVSRFLSLLKAKHWHTKKDKVTHFKISDVFKMQKCWTWFLTNENSLWVGLKTWVWDNNKKLSNGFEVLSFWCNANNVINEACWVEPTSTFVLKHLFCALLFGPKGQHGCHVCSLFRYYFSFLFCNAQLRWTDLSLAAHHACVSWKIHCLNIKGKMIED